MTTAQPDGSLTAADLLFGSTDNAHETLTRHVMSAGRTMIRALERLPRMTREAAVREASVAAVGLLKVDLMELLVTGLRENRDIFSAARRTLDMPGSKELVGLAPHRITTVQQPSVGILVDGHRVHTLQLGLSIFFEVTGLVAGIHAGRLAGVHAGRGHIGVALTIHELEVLTKRMHLELPGMKAFERGFRLLPASAYPDASHGHLGGQHTGLLPGGELPGAMPVGGHFPGVDLMDSHVPQPAFPATELAAAGFSGADLSAAAPPGIEPDLTAQTSPSHPSAGPGPGHSSRAEPDRPSASWWENPEPHSGPTHPT
jgi:hypothetical protein